MKPERIYLDSAPVIYLVERVAPFAAPVGDRLSKGECVLISSDLTRLECRVKPMRSLDNDLLRDYDDYFENALQTVVPLSSKVIDRATTIRAQYNFKTPDAIHLAAAMESNCDVFLTNDRRLDKFTEIKVEIVQM